MGIKRKKIYPYTRSLTKTIFSPVVYRSILVMMIVGIVVMLLFIIWPEKTFAQPSYCTASSATPSPMWIARVQITSNGSLDNSSSYSSYSDYTETTVTLAKNVSTSIVLTHGGSYLQHRRVWIDYNQDGDFVDAGEMVVTADSVWDVSTSFTIPWTASDGTTHMRIRTEYYGSATPTSCWVTQYGETEDYTVNIPTSDTTTPVIIFTWSTPANGATTAWTNQTLQMQITEANLSEFRYTRSGIQRSLYDSGLVLMMDFDNVTGLWENSSTVKDASQYGNYGMVAGATWAWVGKQWWAYSFNGSNDYITGGVIEPTYYTISLWFKNTW